MTNEELTIMLLDKIGWDYDKILNPGHYKNTKDLFAGDLVHAIFCTNSTPEAAEFLGVAYKTIVTVSSRFLQPSFGKLNGGNETWKYKFLHYLELKPCSSCKQLLPYSEYHRENYQARGIHPCCKRCRAVENSLSYKKESVKESHRKSYEKNRPKIRERNIKYKGERALRVPGWSQKEQIVEFYSDCPKDYHVDHIIPLKGELVSGLHVIQNLQYLSAEENMQKGNKYEII